MDGTGEISGEVVQAPPAADMRYDDEPGRVARVLVRVDWADGKIREYEALDPDDFQMNDPETDMSFGSMGMSAHGIGGGTVRMMAAVPSLRLSFRANPRRNMHIRTERTAEPYGELPG